MNIEKECENIFDGLRKVLFYVGHGKYNDFMTLDEVQDIKENLEKILTLEKEYENAKTLEEKEAIYKRLEPFASYSVRDFVGKKIEQV